MTGVLLVGGAGAGAVAFDPARTGTIAKGVQIAGIDVGDLSADQAAARVSASAVPRFRRPIVVRAGGHTFRLTSRTARLRIDVRDAVQRAMDAGRDDPLPIRVWRRMSGGDITVEVPLRPTFSRTAVSHLLGHLHARIDRPARDAAVTPRPSGLVIRAASRGRRVDTAGFTARIERALLDPAAPRRMTARVERIAPGVTRRDLAQRYPAYIVVDRRRFALRLYRHLEHARTYRIAVGKLGLETPAGLYHLQSKQVNPTWYVPNSPWAGDLAGKAVPPGPDNPLKARWMGFDGAAGIHGTEDIASLGTAASHGCIRMSIPEVKEVFDQTPAGAPIYIA